MTLSRRILALAGCCFVLVITLTSCGRDNQKSLTAPEQNVIDIPEAVELPILNGLTPPQSTPPDSIVAKAERYFRDRVSPMSLSVAGVPGNIIGNQANSWLGVRYLWGGNSRSGIDCSHLVYQVYRGAGISSYPFLTTSAMRTYSRFICVNWSSEPGDIVMFGSLGHTGIHMGNGWMVDANSYYNKVMWDNANDPYWRQFQPYPVRYVP